MVTSECILMEQTRLHKVTQENIWEDEHYEKYTKEQMERNARNTYSMKVYPINFATKHKEMLGHAKLLLERGYIATNPKFIN